VDIWVSLEHVYAPDDDDRVRGRWARIMARLQPGVTADQAQAEASAILGRPVQFHTGGIGYSQLRHQLRQPLLLVALLVVLVLLIACGNLANLLLAATTSRDREIAMRGAIGASTSRIVGQLMVESVLLALLGGVLGLVVAYWTSAALLAFLPPAQASALPNLRFAIDVRVLGFVTALSLATCVLFGVLPAWRAAKGVTSSAIRSGEGVSRRNRSVSSQGLVVSQVVMCTALLVVAGVFVRSVQNLRSQDAGYLEDRLVVADVEFPRGYPEPRRDQLIEELRTRAESLPGVDMAAFSHVGQLSGAALEYHIGFPGQGERDDDISSIEQRISPGFLRAMGTRLTAGRDIVASDDERAPLVAIVNEAFARRFFPGRDPIGARFFRFTGARAGQPMEIVGVVRDSKWVNLRDDAPPMYYRPYRQMGGSPSMRLAVRTSGDPDQLARALSLLPQSIDRQVTVSAVPFREIVNRTLVIERLIAQVSTAFSALALLIAAVGLYGVLAYSVARRRREIGVRIAVGAEPATIEGMFLKESLKLVAIGVVLGVPVASVVTRLAASWLFGLSPQDPVSIGIALTALTITTITAAYLPARTASRVDPIHALRAD
jgi:predicted permease